MWKWECSLHMKFTQFDCKSYDSINGVQSSVILCAVQIYDFVLGI